MIFYYCLSIRSAYTNTVMYTKVGNLPACVVAHIAKKHPVPNEGRAELGLK